MDWSSIPDELVLGLFNSILAFCILHSECDFMIPTGMKFYAVDFWLFFRAANFILVCLEVL